MAATDVRTQLYLPSALHRSLKRAAKQRGVSMAQLLREAAEDVVRREAMASADPLEGLIGAAKDETTDLAEEHDQYLYALDRDVS